MNTFDLCGKQEQLPEKARKWNKMWDLWAEGKGESPYAQLMTYQSEVNNGGHGQYFSNVNEAGDVRAEADAVLSILPELLKENLQRAYEAYLVQGDHYDEQSDAIFGECDDVFYEHERLINAILEAYAATMML